MALRRVARGWKGGVLSLTTNPTCRSSCECPPLLLATECCHDCLPVKLDQVQVTQLIASLLHTVSQTRKGTYQARGKHCKKEKITDTQITPPFAGVGAALHTPHSRRVQHHHGLYP
jgi:hypothetical protein